MKLRLRFPTLNRIQLQPQPIEDDDELLKAIKNDSKSRDDAWELAEYGDGEALEKFWEEAAQDK
jgi:hypothetical protein